MDEGYNKTADDFLHTENFILVDKQRRIRGVYNGTLSVDVNRLIKDIELLKQEE
jgi:protein SCO1/2